MVFAMRQFTRQKIPVDRKTKRELRVSGNPQKRLVDGHLQHMATRLTVVAEEMKVQSRDRDSLIDAGHPEPDDDADGAGDLRLDLLRRDLRQRPERRLLSRGDGVRIRAITPSIRTAWKRFRLSSRASTAAVRPAKSTSRSASPGLSPSAHTSTNGKVSSARIRRGRAPVVHSKASPSMTSTSPPRPSQQPIPVSPHPSISETETPEE